MLSLGRERTGEVFPFIKTKLVSPTIDNRKFLEFNIVLRNFLKSYIKCPHRKKNSTHSQKFGQYFFFVWNNNVVTKRANPLALPNMKKFLCEKRFTSNEDVNAATEAHFGEFDKPYFLDGLKKLEYRWTKCIELQGDYWEINLKQ